ncbi:MAG: 4-alpha-glucanotransferase [Acidimicrobiales bacterium]
MNPDGVTRLRAELIGVEPTYVDVDGVIRHASPETLRAIVDALAGGPEPGGPLVVHRGLADELIALPAGTRSVELHTADGGVERLDPITTGAGPVIALDHEIAVGFHRLIVDGEHDVPVVSAPAHVRRLAPTTGIGLFSPTYTLWNEREHGPSLTLLAELAERSAGLGIDTVATLPLYATWIDDRTEPFEPSPYSPVSRMHWSDAYLDHSALPGAEPTAGRPDPLVDWAAVGTSSRLGLTAAVASMTAAERSRLDGYLAERPDVADYARFRAAVERDGVAHPGGIGDVDPAVVDRHAYGQLLMHDRLGELAAELRGRGQSLALDLPIGSHPHGWETWAHPGWFATDMSVGAPPDTLFRGGQNWGFPPLHPAAGRGGGHEPWRRILTRACEHADLLRIDHVMGVHRLWWIPSGADATDGAYVRYPGEELMAVIAAVSELTATTIVGENLGTVPPQVGRLLDDWSVLGLFEDQFVMIDEHEDRGLPAVPGNTVAGIRTHDMPAFRSAYRGDDLSRGPTPPDLEMCLARRRRAVDRYRQAVAAEVGRPVADAPEEVLVAALERLGRSDAHLVMIDLDDLVGETEPHNIPGVTDPVVWRRRMSVDVTTAMEADATHFLLDTVREARGDAGPDTDPGDPIERI